MLRTSGVRWILLAAFVVASVREARADVFAFRDLDGFERCLSLDHLVVTEKTGSGSQTRLLGPIEIQPRCIDAAARLLASEKSKATVMSYVDAIKRLSAAENSIDLIDLVVKLSLPACDDSEVYDVIARVLERPASSGGYVARAKPIIKRCLKDAAFRKDFLEELGSDNKYLAANACDIAREEKLVKSCKGSKP